MAPSLPSQGGDEAAASASASALKREMETLFSDEDAPTVVTALRCTRLGSFAGASPDDDSPDGGDEQVALVLAISRSVSGPSYDVRVWSALPSGPAGRRGGQSWELESSTLRLQALSRVEASPPNAEGIATDFALVADAGAGRKTARAYVADHTLNRNTFLVRLRLPPLISSAAVRRASVSLFDSRRLHPRTLLLLLLLVSTRFCHPGLPAAAVPKAPPEDSDLRGLLGRCAHRSDGTPARRAGSFRRLARR